MSCDGINEMDRAVIELRNLRTDTPKLDRNGKPLRGQAALGFGKNKGSQNKLTKELKDMILGALNYAGGQAYLTRQAKDVIAEGKLTHF